MESQTLRPIRRPWIRFAVRWIIFGIIIWLAVSFFVAYKLTRRPRPFFDEPLPATLAKAESIRLSTSDGHELGAWFVPGQPDRPIVIGLHGNGDSRTGEVGRHSFLTKQGYSSLLVSQRAHGDSTGDQNDFGFSNRHDVIAAVDWIQNHHPNRKIIIWGHSLGAATALFACDQVGPSVCGYILESPYKDLLTATRNRTKMSLPPILDQIAYAGLRTAALVVIPNASQISPFVAAGKMPSGPRVLILVGDQDQHATIPESEAIQNQLGSRSQLVVIPGASHGQLMGIDPERFQKMILDFLESVR